MHLPCQAAGPWVSLTTVTECGGTGPGGGALCVQQRALGLPSFKEQPVHKCSGGAGCIPRTFQTQSTQRAAEPAVKHRREHGASRYNADPWICL